MKIAIGSFAEYKNILSFDKADGFCYNYLEQIYTEDFCRYYYRKAVRDMRELFPSLIGNDGLKGIIARGSLDGSAAHAYILDGPSGSGKHTAASEFAAALLCRERSPDAAVPFPCGKCDMCLKVQKKISPDVKYIASDRATLGVDLIRTLKEDIYIAPNDGDVKLYIIENADTMTVQAQNALLLSLEEPPPFVRFLLLTRDSGALLETVRSRAPIVRMQLFDEESVLSYLKRELPNINDEKLRSAAALSGGALGAALSLASDKKKELEREDLSRELAVSLVKALLSASGEYSAAIASLPKERDAVLKILEYALTSLRDLIAVKRRADIPLLCFSDKSAAEDLARLASSAKINAAYDSLVKSYEDISNNTSPTLSLSCIWLGGIK